MLRWSSTRDIIASATSQTDDAESTILLCWIIRIVDTDRARRCGLREVLPTGNVASLVYSYVSVEVSAIDTSRAISCMSTTSICPEAETSIVVYESSLLVF